MKPIVFLITKIYLHKTLHIISRGLQTRILMHIYPRFCILLVIKLLFLLEFGYIFGKEYFSYWLPKWLSGKESACKCRRPWRHWFDPWVRKIPWRREWQPPPVFVPGKSHGQGAWRTTVHGGHKELDMTERLSTHSFFYIPRYFLTLLLD